MFKKCFFFIIFLVCCVFYLLVHQLDWQPPRSNASNLTFNNISATTAVSSFDLSKQEVYKQCKSFSQKSRLLGPLQRNTSNGELFFPHADASLQDVYLLLRCSPRKETEGGLYLQLAVSYLLSKNLQRLSLQQQARTRVAIFLSDNYNNDMYKRLEKWFKSIYTPYTIVTRIIRTKAGNRASWDHMLNYIKYNEEVKPDTILFLLEDDYIYETDMLYDTIEFFASHNPCFVHPTDYPDRYRWNINDDDGHITIVAGKTRLWRSITSTTLTYVCRFKTFLAFEDIIMQPNNDWEASHDIRNRAGNAVFFSAIPSHGAHTETLLWPNEKHSSSKIDTEAYHKDWWSLARQALFEAQEKQYFPTEKISKSRLSK